MADRRIVRVADARLSGIFWALINATQAPNPGYIWLLMWMPGVSALLTWISGIGGFPDSDLVHQAAGLFTKWMQAIWASGSSSLPRSWRWCSG